MLFSAGEPISPFDRLAEELEGTDSEVAAGLYEGDIAGAPYQVSVTTRRYPTSRNAHDYAAVAIRR